MNVLDVTDVFPTLLWGRHLVQLRLGHIPVPRLGKMVLRASPGVNMNGAHRLPGLDDGFGGRDEVHVSIDLCIQARCDLGQRTGRVIALQQCRG